MYENGTPRTVIILCMKDIAASTGKDGGNIGVYIIVIPQLRTRERESEVQPCDVTQNVVVITMHRFFYFFPTKIKKKAIEGKGIRSGFL